MNATLYQVGITFIFNFSFSWPIFVKDTMYASTFHFKYNY